MWTWNAYPVLLAMTIAGFRLGESVPGERENWNYYCILGDYILFSYDNIPGYSHVYTDIAQLSRKLRC